VIKGRIYGLPTPRQATGAFTLIRRDFAKAKGLDYNITSTDQYLDLCKALTDVKANRWALSGTSSELGSIPNWFGAPNGWARQDDKFVSMYETDNWRAALDFMNKLYKAGVWYPDAFAIDATTAARLFFKGTAAIWTTGTNGYLGNMAEARTADPNYDPDFILPFDVNGGQWMQPTGVANYSLTAVKKASKSRVQELIRIADWLAAPFGTDEYTLTVYGVEGRNFTWKDGNPTPVPSTDPGSGEVGQLAYRYISAAPIVLYSPQYTDYVKAAYETETKLLEHPRDDASVGLYSATKSKSWPAVAKDLGQASLEVVQGRKSLKDWDSAVERQKKTIEAVNSEFASSYAQANS
jgi:putative aldouronate transport system substrate-binding protein